MSEILQRWREGKGLPGLLVIDGHAHLGEWPHGANFHSAQEAAEEAVAIMDANGIHAACILSGGGWVNGNDYHRGNDFLLDCVRRAPDRLIPFAHVNGLDSRRNIMAELERMVGEGVRGLKLYNQPQGYAGDTPNMMAVCEFAQEHSMLLLNHHWSDGEIARLTQAFPAAIFIRGHGGASRLSRVYTNVYDNIWYLHPIGTIEQGVRTYGPEKILFGSDAFMNEPSVGIGLVVYADIPDEDKRLILGLNMARLLQRTGALPTPLQKWLA